MGKIAEAIKASSARLLPHLTAVTGQYQAVWATNTANYAIKSAKLLLYFNHRSNAQGVSTSVMFEIMDGVDIDTMIFIRYLPHDLVSGIL